MIGGNLKSYKGINRAYWTNIVGWVDVETELFHLEKMLKIKLDHQPNIATSTTEPCP